MDQTDQQSSHHAHAPRQQASRHGIFRKVLISTLVISGLPLVAFGIFAILSIDSIGDTIVTRVFDTLDDRTRQTMELQAVLTANSVSKFLQQRVNDLFDLREVHPTDINYLQYSTHHEAMIWQRSGTNDDPGEERLMLPIYSELVYIDADGNEVLKIRDNAIVPPDQLRNVSDPVNTDYRSETYFQETMSLSNSEVYVSHLSGSYVTRQEQLGDAETIEEAIEGKRFEGVIRMATPVFVGGDAVGMVMISIDHRHLMELTQHILPNSKSQTVFPVYESGDYAFMFDERGWIITHPKYWNFPGLDSTGQVVPAYSEHTSAADLKVGRMPFNLDSAGFVHENYPLVASEVRGGNSGSVITTNVGGVTKVMAYAPISFSYGRYRDLGIFGGITIGAELHGFRGHAVSIAGDLNEAVILIRNNMLVFILLTSILALGMSWLLSRNFTRPIVRITDESKALARGQSLDMEPLDRSDEIGELSRTFNHMADELEVKRTALLDSMSDLRQSKAKVEDYARDLEYQISVFESIQRISNILGTTTELDEVLRAILKRSVEGLGFDRAILYLIDDAGERLEYREMYGFSLEEEELARRSRYHLERFDCIETRVVKTGDIAFIRDFRTYSEATDVDHKIRKLAKSNSFAFVPLKVKETIIGIMGADKLRSGDPITDKDVNSLQVLANQASRIIENTRLYQELLKQRNFVEDIIQCMLNGVITTDQDGTVTSFNRAAETILGLTARGVVGEPIKNVLGRYEPLWDVVQAALITRTVRSRHDIELTVSDVPKVVSVNISRFNPENDGSDSGAIVILQDVTEKKKIDDHLQHVERLAALGRFAAGISHEIRNPVTGINVFLDDLHDKVVSQPHIAGVISRALEEVDRLDRLVNEILEFASPSRAALSPRSVNDVIEAALRFVHKECRSVGIEVVTNLSDSLPFVAMDAEKIRQALLNLFLNAIQVMTDGGTLTVTSRFEQDRATLDKSAPRAQRTQPRVVVEIGDSGPGISADRRVKIFEPFYSERRGGTGLGLSITHSIIADHGGDIEVAESRCGGALFVVRLPVSIESVAAAGSSTPEKNS